MVEGLGRVARDAIEGAWLTGCASRGAEMDEGQSEDQPTGFLEYTRFRMRDSRVGVLLCTPVVMGRMHQSASGYHKRRATINLRI